MVSHHAMEEAENGKIIMKGSDHGNTPLHYRMCTKISYHDCRVSGHTIGISIPFLYLWSIHSQRFFYRFMKSGNQCQHDIQCTRKIPLKLTLFQIEPGLTADQAAIECVKSAQSVCNTLLLRHPNLLWLGFHFHHGMARAAPQWICPVVWAIFNRQIRWFVPSWTAYPNFFLRLLAFPFFSWYNL